MISIESVKYQLERAKSYKFQFKRILKAYSTNEFPLDFVCDGFEGNLLVEMSGGRYPYLIEFKDRAKEILEEQKKLYWKVFREEGNLDELYPEEIKENNITSCLDFINWVYRGGVEFEKAKELMKTILLKYENTLRYNPIYSKKNSSLIKEAYNLHKAAIKKIQKEIDERTP